MELCSHTTDTRRVAAKLQGQSPTFARRWLRRHQGGKKLWFLPRDAL